MNVKHRSMKRDDWKRILDKTYISRDFDNYVAGLIIMNDVKEDLIISYPYGQKTIVKKNYKWLEVAYKNKNYFATSMFDENNELLEIYFDINKGNKFDDINNPEFDDMFLDVVLDNSGLVYVLDEDELKEAYEQKEITKKEYLQAIKDKDELYEYLVENKEEILKEYQRLFTIMYQEIK